MTQSLAMAPALGNGVMHLAGLGLPEVFGKMPMGVAYCRMVCDNGLPADFEYLYTNPEFHRITGLGDIIGKKLSDIVPAVQDSDAWVIASYGRVATTGQPENFEYFMASLQQWFTIHAFCPQPGCFMAVFSVVTGRKDVEARLERSEAHYRAIIDASPSPSAVIDRQGKVVYLNAAFTRTFGYVAADVPTVDDWRAQAYPDASYRSTLAQEWQQRLDAAQATGQPFVPLEVQLRCKSQATKTVLASATPLAGAQVDAGLVLMTLEDITVRRDLERALHDSADILRRAQAVARVGSFSLATQGDTFHISAETARIFDLEGSGDFSFAQWFARIHPDDQAGVDAAWNAALRGAPYDMTYRIQARGQEVWIRALADLRLDADGTLRRAVGTVQDITDLKLIEQALRESEARLNRVLLGSDQGYWEWDLQTQRFTVSPRFESMLDYAPGEMQLQPGNWDSFVQPDDHQRSQRSVQALLKGLSERHEVELRCRTKSGQWRWMLSRGAIAQRDAQGRAHIISGTHTDITLRKSLEVELQRQKQELEDLYNHAPCGYHSLDAQGTILRINDTALAWLGRSRDEVVGKARLTDFLTPRSIAAFKTQFPAFLASGHLSELELELMAQDGRMIPVLLSATAVLDAQGKFLMSRSVLLDYRTLRAQQEAFRMALTAAPMAVRVARLQDNRVVLVNQAYCNLLKRSQAEAIGLDIGPFYVDPQVFASIRSRLAQGEVILNELVEFQLPDRPEEPRVWALSSFAVIDYLGAPSVLAWLYDISDRELLRRQIELQRDKLELMVQERTLGLSIAKQAAEAADRFKSAILSNISHEFRTPMNGIMGMLGIVRQRATDPKVKEQLGKAETSAKNLLAILTGLIDLAAAEAGQLGLQHVPFTVAQMLQRLPAQFASAAQAKGLLLVVDAVEPAALGAERYLGDPQRLEQIVWEMVGNAIKFSSQGSIRVQARLQPDAGGARLELAVSDQGIGIRSQDHYSIFEPFKQIDASRTRQFGGNGIGLALCRRLASQMQAEIAVASALGEGSTFTLRLPLKAAPGDAQPLLTP